MKEIGRKPFEHYADKAAYDMYIHDDYYDGDPSSDEYCALPKEVFERVDAKAQADWDNYESMSSLRQFGEYLRKEGLIPQNDMDWVIEELYHDYILHYKVVKDLALRIRRSKYI